MWPILIVGSDPGHRDELATILSGIHRRVRVLEVGKASEALRCLDEARVWLVVVAEPALIEATLGVVVALRRRFPDTPVLTEVPLDHPLVSLQAARQGASDWIASPAAPWEWRSRVGALLRATRQREAIAAALRRSTYHLIRARGRLAPEELLSLLTRAHLFRDAVTADHELRTARYARLIAEALALPEAQRCSIETGACLHDIGMLAIPDRVLKKGGRYTDEEYKLVQAHPRIGHEILFSGQRPVLRAGAEIALAHHERYDGSGYPRGLAGEAIPLAARIVAPADVLASLTARGHHRREPMSIGDGLDFLEQRCGTLFDPACVAPLRARHSQLERLGDVAASASSQASVR